VGLHVRLLILSVAAYVKEYKRVRNSLGLRIKIAQDDQKSEVGATYGAMGPPYLYLDYSWPLRIQRILVRRPPCRLMELL
jgi:hypothetical protein